MTKMAMRVTNRDTEEDDEPEGLLQLVVGEVGQQLLVGQWQLHLSLLILLSCNIIISLFDKDEVKTGITMIVQFAEVIFLRNISHLLGNHPLLALLLLAWPVKIKQSSKSSIMS